MNSTVVSSAPSLDEQSYEHTVNVLLRLSIFYLIFLSAGTILLNGLVLFTIHKDPLKCLRSPSATLIAGLTSADFLTGLLVEPLFVGIYVWGFYGHANPTTFYRTARVAEILAFVTINASFLIILGLAVIQYTGMAYPAVYQRIVSPTSAKVAVACIFLYTLLFSVLPEVGAFSEFVFYEVDLYLHTVLITIALVVLYILMYFKYQLLWAVQGDMVHRTEESEQQRQEMDKEFIKGTFILTAFLIVTTCPYTISIFVWMYKSHYSYRDILQTYIALIICQNIMFLKFLWDPVIFALRLKKYRKSLVFIFGSLCGCGERNALPNVAYHRENNSVSEFEGIDNSVV